MNKKILLGFTLVLALAFASLALAQIAITKDADMDQEPVMAMAANGNLVVVYNSGGGQGQENGIYSAVSGDNGATWSQETFIASSWDDEALTKDNSGNPVLLAIGSEGLDTWTSSDGVSWTNMGKVTPTSSNNSVGDILQGRDGYYYATYSDTGNHVFVTRSTDLVNWSPAVQLSFGNNFEFDASMMQASDNKLIIVYNSYSDQGISFVTSMDGVAWTQPQSAAKITTNAHIGLNVLEFNGKPTMFFQGYSNGPGLYYSSFDGQNWSSPQRVYSDVPFGADAVPLGDRIGIVFARDVGEQNREIYFDTVSLTTQPNSGCNPETVQCDSSGQWTQKCNDTGQWYNAGYCPNGCQNGNCIEQGENQTEIIRLNQVFKLASGQSAYYSGEKQKIKIRLEGIGSRACQACQEGRPCPPCEGGFIADLSAVDKVSGLGLRFSLKQGDSQSVFGFILSLKELSSSTAMLVLSEPSGGGGGQGAITVQVGKQFKLPQNILALITEKGATLSKLSLTGVSTSTKCPLPEASPAPPSNVPNGFRNAKWECYDGTTSQEGSDSSCKSSETWATYAKKECESHCNSESGKCGVNSFSVGNDCGSVQTVTQQEIANTTMIKPNYDWSILPRDCSIDSAGNKVCKKIPACEQSTIASFVASTPNGTFQFSLRTGEKYETELVYYLDELVGGEKRYTAVMRVEKSGGSGEYQKVSLGVPFRVQPGDRVVVIETGLNLRIANMYPENETVVFEAMQPVYALAEKYATRKQSVSPLTGRVISGIGESIIAEKVYTVAQPTRASIGKPIAVPSISSERPVSIADVPYGGYYKVNPQHSAQLFGQTVEVNWVKAKEPKGPMVAEMVVKQDSEQNFLRVKLDELFKLGQYGTAYVMDEGRETLKVSLLGLSATDSKCAENEKCFARTIAKVELSLQPTPCASNQNCASTGVGMVTVLTAGESTNIGPYTVRLAYADDSVGAFVVSKQTGEQNVPVYLNEEFKLGIEQTAQVVGENVFLRLNNNEGFTVEATVFKKDNSNGTSPAMQIKVKPGSSFSAFGLQFNFIEWIGKSRITRWVVSKDESGTQNVLLGEQFKLLIGGTANIMNANLQVQLLNIQQSKCKETEKNDSTTIEKCLNQKPTASIAVRSIYGNAIVPQKELNQIRSTDIAQIGEIIKQAITNKIITTAGENSTVQGTMPPGNEVFDLTVGEKAFYQGYEITLLDLSYDRAVLVVNQKDTPSDTFVINLEKGWSLFSIPNIEVKGSDCDSTLFRLFEYVDGKFVNVKDPQPHHAYWLHNKGNACEVKAVYLDKEFLKEAKPLEPGWNFVAYLQDPMNGKTPFELGCPLRVAFAYSNGQWINLKGVRLSSEFFGKAVVVYSSDSCQFSGTEGENLTPPALPVIDLTN
ncbi:MAG: sialidase family protein [Candidatus Micrarchaeota archaeon]